MVGSRVTATQHVAWLQGKSKPVILVAEPHDTLKNTSNRVGFRVMEHGWLHGYSNMVGYMCAATLNVAR